MHLKDAAEILYVQEKRQAHQYVEPLLRALWHAEFQQRWGLYRVALVMLADVGLEFGMTKWSRRLIEDILPQVTISVRSDIILCDFADMILLGHDFTSRAKGLCVGDVCALYYSCWRVRLYVYRLSLHIHSCLVDIACLQRRP